MGCDCCKIYEPEQYEKCERLRSTGRKVPSPCGGIILNDTPNSGDKFTPAKKKRKKHRR